MPETTIALARQSELFFIPEINAGTLEEPSASDLVLTTSTPEITQERETFDDEQIRNTRSKLSPIAGRYLAGTWGFSTYIKPSGTPGAAPAEDRLLEGLMGSKTSDATSVSYPLTSDAPSSYSLWYKDGHTVYMVTGATVDQGVFNIDGKNPGAVDWSGMHMKLLWTGTDALGANIADGVVTEITPVSVDLFNEGSIFTIGDERFKVTNVGASTLTVIRGYGGTTPVAHTSGDVITPWLPTGTESGVVVHGRLGNVTLDSTNYNVLTTVVTITNGIKYYEEEKNGQDYSTDYGVPEDRTVESTISVYFRKGDTQRFKDALEFTDLAFVIPLGSVAGKIMEIGMPQCKVKAPVMSGDAERQQEITLLPYATTGYDDEISITYK